MSIQYLPRKSTLFNCQVNIEEVRRKQSKYETFLKSSEYLLGRSLADAWCAAFVWKKTNEFPYPITEEVFRRIEENPSATPLWMTEEINRLAKQYQFFHWHLAFPDVFFFTFRANEKPENDQTGWLGGFDVVLGNPPWERIKLHEKEWFSGKRPDIAGAPNAAERRKRIKKLAEEDVDLFQAFCEDLRKADGESHLIRNSSRYPLCGRGDINTYTIFAEGMRNLIESTGRVGCVLPTGIATDDTTKFFFKDVVERKSLFSLYSFENEEFVFPDIHHATRFCLFTVGSGAEAIAEEADFVFFARQVGHIKESERRFKLSPKDIALLNPNTNTCAIFRSLRDAELTKAIYRRVPVLIRKAVGNNPEENPWCISFNRMFDMSNDSNLFRTREQLETDGARLEGNIYRQGEELYLPLYEAKMIHHFDHRWGTYEGQTEAQANQGKLPELTSAMHSDPWLLALPRYWLALREVRERLATDSQPGWLVGFRDITGATVLRTVISTVIPETAVGNNLPLLVSGQQDAINIVTLPTILSSFCCDFVARFKVGGTHLNFFILEQIPILTPKQLVEPCLWVNQSETNLNWFRPRILELTYTAWDLRRFAQDCGWSGSPFRWDEERRFLMRCELDAAFFHLYLPAQRNGEWGQAKGEGAEDYTRLKESFPNPRHAVDYIMETFPIVKRYDEEKFGDYRTKKTILKIYDLMQQSIGTGNPYQTLLDPPPADPRVAHSS